MKTERVTLAQELHDGIAQDLVALGFSIDSLIADSNNADSKSKLRELRFTVTALIDKVRREIHVLRSETGSIESVNETDISYELQRVFAELIRNIQEHSQASQINIEIKDDGVGGVAHKDGSFGLIGVHERITQLNGVILIDSNNNGTRITIQIPLDR